MRFAKAQTILGNRLVYGNYVEGYDLIDENDQPIKFGYQVFRTQSLLLSSLTTYQDEYHLIGFLHFLIMLIYLFLLC